LLLELPNELCAGRGSGQSAVGLAPADTAAGVRQERPSGPQMSSAGSASQLSNGQQSDSGSWSDWWSSPSWPVYDTVEGTTRCLKFFSSVVSIFVSFKLTPVFSGFGSVSDKRQEHMNKVCAHRALQLVLSLKGYYIKAAQTLCGAGVFPDEFDDVFAVLLDQCPKEPFSVVKEIVESELGCPMGQIFKAFDPVAVAAASIGQVHLAFLKDGTRVAVKVQYPSVERFFRMDVKMVEMLLRLQGMGEQVEAVIRSVEEQFKAEFNYAIEASLMRECAQNLSAKYSKSVVVPLPLDATHPALKGLPVKTLCTRKVLVMERVDGVPIRTFTMQNLEAFAKSQGTTAKELKRMLRKSPEELDPAMAKKLLTMRPVSEAAHLMRIAGVKLRNGVSRCLRCSTCGGVGARGMTAPKPVPLNGPRIARLLFEVHGHEIFHDGLFNSDPHAGNVFMLRDGRLGLLDYGAVTRLSTEQQLQVARLIVAVAKEDDDAVPDALFACGFRCTNMDRRLALLLGYVCFHRGPHPDDMNRIADKVGMPKDADLMTLDEYIKGGKIDQIENFPTLLVMLQRCCMVLSGVGMELGAGRLSTALMLRPHAERCLQRLGAKRFWK